MPLACLMLQPVHPLLFALALALPIGVAAEDKDPPRLGIKGFGTLGLARSDDSDAGFVRDLSQPRGLTTHWSGKIDSVLGVQANYRFGERTEAVLQAVSRYRYDNGFGPEITWAFLRHDFSPEWSLRAGRIGTEFFMLSDSRLVGYANLTVRPPVEFYGPLVFSYFDGLDLAATTQLSSGLLRGKLFAGHAAERAPVAPGLSWNLQGSRMFGGHVDYLSGPWQVRLGHTAIRFSHEMPINEFAGIDVLGLAPQLAAQGTWSHYDSLGVVYEQGALQVQGMLNRIHNETDQYEDSWAGYLIGAYRLGNFTPYTGYSQTRSSPLSLPAEMPAAQAAVIRYALSYSHSDQRTIFVGTRWDFAQNLALKAQVDRTHGQPDSRFLFRETTSGWDGRMTVFSLALDFVF